jgi:transcription elongation GreA/GreB family factor
MSQTTASPSRHREATSTTSTSSGERNSLGRWPMTREAWQRLIDEVASLRGQIAAMEGEAVWEPGAIHVPTAQTARRLETLAAVLEAAVCHDDEGCAVIGRRATVEEDGVCRSYSLVFPGDGDPHRGWVSAESPLGAAMVGARPGDIVEVVAPAGRRTVTIIAVD